LEYLRIKKYGTTRQFLKSFSAGWYSVYIIAGGGENDGACARLFKLAPSEEFAAILFNGLQEGLRGRDIGELSVALTDALRPYKKIIQGTIPWHRFEDGKKRCVEQSLENNC
jgi:hypothetical protein